MVRGWLVAVLLLACQRVPPAQPEPPAAKPSASSTAAAADPNPPLPVESIFEAYAKVDLDHLPASPWVDKAVRISGHLADRSPDQGTVETMVLGRYLHGIRCSPVAEAQPVAHVGDVVVIEGTFEARKYQPNVPAGIPLVPEPELVLELLDCKLVSAHSRAFGVTVSKLGARLMDLTQFLDDLGEPALRKAMIGKVFAVRGEVNVDDGSLELRPDGRESRVRCVGPGRATPIFPRENVMVAGTLSTVEEAKYGSVATLEGCQPVDP